MIWHIVLPLSIPGILIAVVLVFILTFGDYAITKVAGPVYPSSLSVLMYTEAFTLQQWGGAACIGVVIIVTSLVFVAHLCARRARLAGDAADDRRNASPAPPATQPAARASAEFIALLIIALLVIWTAVPLFMAVMWSLVNPDDPWSPPAVLPPSLSLAQWEYVFTYSEIVRAVAHELRPGADRHDRVLRPGAADGLCARPLHFPRQGSAAHPDPAARS